MTVATHGVAHPLIDAVGTGWVATETRAPIVFLTEGLADLMHRAALANLRTLVITAKNSRLTPHAAETMSTVGAVWVVRDNDGTLFDGRTGAILADLDAAIRSHRLRSVADIAPGFRRIPARTTRQLVMTFSTRHRVSRPVLLGGVTERMCSVLTDSEPVAWGASEPLSAAWDRTMLSEYSRRRMPNPTRWAITGSGTHNYAGTITVRRTSEGLEELTHAWVDRGDPGPDTTQIAADAMFALTAARESGMPLLGTAFAKVGATDLSRHAAADLPPNPLALLIGAPGLRQLGTDANWWATRYGATILGSSRLPTVIVPLGSDTEIGWPRLHEIMSSLEPDVMSRVFGGLARTSATEGAPDA